jgi:Ras-related protein Rab-5C
MKDAHCAVIVYDVNKKTTLDRCKSWIKIWNEYKKDEAITLLVGNKVDLPREVEYEHGLAMAEKIGNGDMAYCEVSAKTGLGISRLFEKIIDNIFIAKNSAAKQEQKDA